MYLFGLRPLSCAELASRVDTEDSRVTEANGRESRPGNTVMPRVPPHRRARAGGHPATFSAHDHRNDYLRGLEDNTPPHRPPPAPVPQTTAQAPRAMPKASPPYEANPGKGRKKKPPRTYGARISTSFISRSICSCCFASSAVSCSVRIWSSLSCKAMISISAFRFTL